TRHSFDINASAYGVSMTRANNLFALPDGTTSDARLVDWQLVPSALSYSRMLGDRVVGSFGVFIPYTTDVDLRAPLRQLGGGNWTFGIDSVRNEYDYMASIGVRVRDDLRVGVTLNGVYVSTENLALVATGTPGASDAPFFNVVQHETRGEYGLRLGVGVQWTPRPELELGLAVQSPTLTGFRSLKQDSVNASYLGSAMGGNYMSSHVDELSKPFDLSTPLFVRAGAAYALGRLQLLLDGSFSAPLDAQGKSFDRRVNGNVRLGALFTQGERLLYGFGVFSDRNGYRDASSSYLGCAGGVRLATHYTIEEGQRRLTFATTLAGRYAYGWGSAQVLLLSDEGPRPSADLKVHELAFNLGGSVTF
ncbi:MAG TPA: hypothetical protein VFX59_23705, partial [Polyangiales bacterium]|nr:hypothetical protein [Polyangiales bacterium]